MDREKIIKELEAVLSRDPLDVPWDLIDDTLTLLKEQEVKTGHWIEYPEALAYDDVFDDSFIVCSVCKHAFNIIDNCTEEFDYCPHCGAKMEEVANDDA